MDRVSSVDAMLLVMMAFFILLLPLQWILAVILAAGFHELCHYLAIKSCGGEVHGINFGISGISMRVSGLTEWKEMICSLAGPAGGAVLLIFARWIPRIAICASIQSLFNLLPVYPLDGGRALRCVLIRYIRGEQAERISDLIGSVVVIGICVVGIVGSILFRVGVFPILVSSFVALRGIYEKYLANRSHIRYNRGNTK